MTLRDSLLDDALISIRCRDGRPRQVTLPELIVALLRNEVLAFEALQAHQWQAWHCFLVQLAAMASARALGGTLPEDATRWKDALLSLSGGDRAAWALVAEDLWRPAFMQPPVPEGSLHRAGYRDDVRTPDQIDVLITSKNHDVKAQRIGSPCPEHWLYALVTLQTTGGFLGAGNYGIARMNGGYGSRPFVGLTPELLPGVHFRRDVEVLLDIRPSLAEHYDLGGHALLWLLPWDGKKQSALEPKVCDPYFIEVCRRVRLLDKEGTIRCLRANTAAPRMVPPEGGVTGDPWAPVQKDPRQVLTVGDGGFTYDLIQRILFSDDFERPPTLLFREEERGGAYLVATVLVRGQGKTGGLHTRIIPLSGRAAEWLAGSEEKRERLGRLAEERVHLAAEVQRRALYPALKAMLRHAASKQIRPWMEAFDRAVDAHFFDYLWAALEQSEEEARRAWERLLAREARQVFEQAVESLPAPSGQLWRVRSGGHAIFEAAIRKVLPRAFETPAFTT